MARSALVLVVFLFLSSSVYGQAWKDKEYVMAYIDESDPLKHKILLDYGQSIKTKDDVLLKDQSGKEMVFGSWGAILNYFADNGFEYVDTQIQTGLTFDHKGKTFWLFRNKLKP